VDVAVVAEQGELASPRDEGRRRFREAAIVHRRGIERHFCEHVSDDEAATLIELFARLRAVAPPPA
jgi:hypothetical protein